MAYDPHKHHRRSIRLKGYDYALPGAYFITLVTFQRECLFGEVINGEMHLNKYGSLTNNEWQRLGRRFDDVVTDEFIVMPNHIHGCLRLVGAGQEKILSTSSNSLAPPLQIAPRDLGAIVRAYKSTTTRLINGLRHSPGVPVWQRNYYEHIIRGSVDLSRIVDYIQNNPSKWGEDEENPFK